jgi:hypothetical protein
LDGEALGYLVADHFARGRGVRLDLVIAESIALRWQEELGKPNILSRLRAGREWQVRMAMKGGRSHEAASPRSVEIEQGLRA